MEAAGGMEAGQDRGPLDIWACFPLSLQVFPSARASSSSSSLSSPLLTGSPDALGAAPLTGAEGAATPTARLVAWWPGGLVAWKSPADPEKSSLQEKENIYFRLTYPAACGIIR